jgi:hypothetical protein
VFVDNGLQHFVSIVRSDPFPGRSDRLRAYSQFYRQYQGGRYFSFFQNELKAMVKKGVGLDPTLFK